MRVGRARRRREARAGRVEPARGGKRLLLVLSDAVFGDHAHDGRVDGRQGGSVARLPRRAGRKKVEKAGSSWRLGRGVTQRAGEGGGGAVKRRPVELVALQSTVLDASWWKAQSRKQKNGRERAEWASSDFLARDAVWAKCGERAERQPMATRGGVHVRRAVADFPHGVEREDGKTGSTLLEQEKCQRGSQPTDEPTARPHSRRTFRLLLAA